MCRTPEIVEHSRSTLEDGSEYVSYRCVNCDRWAYECPICKEIRCDSDLHHSMVGHFPLACNVCRPDGIRQTFTFETDAPGVGPYRSGARLEVDDPEIEGFTTT